MVKDGKLKAKDIKNDTVIFVGEDNLHYEKFADGSVKCIEEEIPFDIPEGWSWCRLQSVTSILTDGTHKTPTYSEEGYIFLSSKNVTSGKIDWDNIMYIPDSLHEELYNRIAPQINDILLAKNGTTGIAAIVDKEEIFDIYVSLALIRIVENTIEPLYILRAIGSSYVQNYFNSSLKGIGVPNLHLEHIRKTLLPIPPYSEQSNVVSRADMLLPLVEQIERDKRELGQLVSATKSKILDLAIRGQLVPQDPNDEPASVLLERIRAEKEELIKAGKIKRDKKESIIFRGEDNSYYRIKSGKTMCIDSEIPYDIPANWDWVTLPEIVFFQEGPGILRKDFRENGIPLIRISGLQTDTVSLDGCDYLDPEMVQKKWEHFKLELGDVVLCSSASIGKASIVGNDAVGAIPYTGQIRFKMSKAILRDYFLYIAMSSVYLNQVNQMKTGNCIQHYGPTHLKEVIIPLPPVREQMLIVAKIKTLFGILDKILLNTD
jgi:type I restriction enzyme S subunit